jgi:DNA-binding CsgD family transcriptional regulator
MCPECPEDESLRRTLPERTAAPRAVSLDADKARTWWDEGRTLDLDAALALIRAAEAARIAQEERPGGLTPREIDVLRLLAEGHSDREIAALLFISPRTVNNHVQHIYDKIAVSSRSAATKWAIEHNVA